VATTTTTYNPITDKTKRFFQHEITKNVLFSFGIFGFITGVVLIVLAVKPYYYAGLKESQARNVSRQAITNKYGIDRTLTFVYHGIHTGHVLGRTAWISKWTKNDKENVCVYAWSESRHRVSYVGGCPK
jgi:hypothetical protein